jgi:bifunctional DNase/RNase
VIVGHVVKRLIRGVVVGIARHWIVSLLVLVMLGGTVYSLAAQGIISIPGLSPIAASGGASATAGEVREMVVEDIRSNNQQTQMLMILREKGGTRRLVMNVGPSEALAVASDINPSQVRGRTSIEPPTSYDLMRTLVKELGGSVNRVVVTSFTNDTFYAKVVMNTDSRLVEVESRPSDAVALALRARVPIFAATSVLEQVGRRS